MKKLIVSLLFYVLICFILYAAFAFVHYTTNAGLWSENSRFLYSILAFWFIIPAIMIYVESK